MLSNTPPLFPASASWPLFELHNFAVLVHTLCLQVTQLVIIIASYFTAMQGLGLEFAKQLLDKGNTVVAAVRNPSPGLLQLQQAAPEGKLFVTQLDVSSTASIQRWAGR
jgi:short-subunit dehydrogenase involved in D-alanine esterification of teichoic acids